MKPEVAAANALACVLEARAGEKLQVVCDEELRPVGEAFASAGVGLGLWTRMLVLPPEKAPRAEIPPLLESFIVGGGGDIFVNLLKGGADETPFRIRVTRLEKRRRVRLGHSPGITPDMLTDGALALTGAEYRELQGRAEELLSACQGATAVRIQDPDGTDLRFSVAGRDFFTDTKLNWETLKWMNLPVGEVIVGPVESSAEGVLTCSSAIGGIGLIGKPLTLEVAGGRVTRVSCAESSIKAQVEKVQSTDGWAGRIGEFAFGLNPRARMSSSFLETEKLGGTVHVAFGNNADYPGGKNTSKTHQDFLITRPSVTLSFGDREKEVLSGGKLALR